MEENIEDYATIWTYVKGETEPQFEIYKYPSFSFNTTNELSNLNIIVGNT